MPAPRSPRNDLMWMLPVYVSCWAGAVTAMMTSPHSTGDHFGRLLHEGVAGILLTIAGLLGFMHWIRQYRKHEFDFSWKSIGLTVLWFMHMIALFFGLSLATCMTRT